MADTGTQSPLGINTLGSLLQNIGFWINPTAESYMGKCKLTDPTPGSAEDYKPGTLVEDTCLKWLTYAIHDAYQNGAASQANPLSPSGSYTLDATTYNNLISIGKDVIPALGNSPPNTWKTDDPSGLWVNAHTGTYTTDQAGAPANAGYPFYNFDTNPTEAYKNEGQCASWYPYLATNSGQVVPNRAITQWGWIRCFALQAWNEYNYNGQTATGTPNYKSFCDSFNTCFSFTNTNNPVITSIENSKSFLKGAYSNMNDLISADVSGVCLASRDFGQDLINLGNAIDLAYIKKFGLPSAVIQTLYKHNALTQSCILALLASGFSQNDIMAIANNEVTASKDQEQRIYAAMSIITGTDLADILLTLNCMTKTIEFLSDLVSVRKMFPLSYAALTVPVYNANPGPTNSKTYYLLFIDGGINSQLVAPSIQDAVGTLTPPGSPPPATTTVPPIVAPTADVITPAAAATGLVDIAAQLKNLAKEDLTTGLRSTSVPASNPDTTSMNKLNPDGPIIEAGGKKSWASIIEKIKQGKR